MVPAAAVGIEAYDTPLIPALVDATLLCPNFSIFLIHSFVTALGAIRSLSLDTGFHRGFLFLHRSLTAALTPTHSASVSDSASLLFT